MAKTNKLRADQTKIISATLNGQFAYVERIAMDCDHYTYDRRKAKRYNEFDANQVIESLKRGSQIMNIRIEDA